MMFGWRNISNLCGRWPELKRYERMTDLWDRVLLGFKHDLFIAFIFIENEVKGLQRLNVFSLLRIILQWLSFLSSESLAFQWTSIVLGRGPGNPCGRVIYGVPSASFSTKLFGVYDLIWFSNYSLTNMFSTNTAPV